MHKSSITWIHSILSSARLLWILFWHVANSEIKFFLYSFQFDCNKNWIQTYLESWFLSWIYSGEAYCCCCCCCKVNIRVSMIFTDQLQSSKYIRKFLLHWNLWYFDIKQLKIMYSSKCIVLSVASLFCFCVPKLCACCIFIVLWLVPHMGDLDKLNACYLCDRRRYG